MRRSYGRYHNDRNRIRINGVLYEAVNSRNDKVRSVEKALKSLSDSDIIDVWNQYIDENATEPAFEYIHPIRELRDFCDSEEIADAVRSGDLDTSRDRYFIGTSDGPVGGRKFSDLVDENSYEYDDLIDTIVSTGVYYGNSKLRKALN